uniref:Uncharacterized protein n=2 Tax=Anguilla anguilla TaxID=7936 RepID=A0A0E9T3G3_ANGAN
MLQVLVFVLGRGPVTMETTLVFSPPNATHGQSPKAGLIQRAERSYSCDYFHAKQISILPHSYIKSSLYSRSRRSYPE